jgi:hypothetical protein
MQKIEPMPEVLIQHWEDYHFMLLWDEQYNQVFPQFPQFTDPNDLNRILALSPQMHHVLQTKLCGALLVSLAECCHFVSQSPGFARIFLARLLLFSHAGYILHWPSPYQLRLLLGVSWDDIRVTLSAARSIIGQASCAQIIAGTITILALVLELYPTQLSSLFIDFGSAFFGLIQRNNPVRPALYTQL